ncbi:response regulator [Corallococcus exiguus]|uniref:Response regulator n=8 Tax=Corallococcus TaxID=83461 RepID=H8MS14_CORCM|nr:MULTISPECIES: response regulator [Corallococcus]NOJ95530.1 response regulator [Corallococcus coralloides]RKH47079.1 response regulator [Corallococcus sp. AB050B]RKI29723.1 response regulator [Corallococcus sp. AB004]RYZ40925.1 MAG: response regulator [Myxococcaceae bacterium]GMU03044.1 response regulator [Corallococcus sp. KH5-1]GMU04334.1 response regulator [Corallococcus sp. NO1]
MSNFILVVDDDASHRTLICDALQEMGYATIEAKNGREALDLLEDDIPGAVLLDLRMPVMSGWGLLDALKKMPRARNLPIIIISGYGFEWEAELVGAAGYISKPVDLDKVRTTVQQIVGPPEVAMVH